MKTDDGYDLDNINLVTNQHNFEIGKYYKTRGGWKVICVWICRQDYDFQDSIYFVHRPGEKNIESVPIVHNPLGIALSSFAINAPPHYGLQPADIVGEWIEL